MRYASGGDFHKDLGLSQAVNGRSSNNEIYGVLPYIAPEIFKESKFSQKSDIYGFDMIMWELTTGCKPFANVNMIFIPYVRLLKETDLKLQMIHQNVMPP
ncbi:hypothetical protein C1646_753331 [Rhizophagus diaphanus]|nr:hypothetical protein C1646_753331 [Rhizophagus diaphanus] [Rhizophagus sp. MUCL 43196]